VVAHLLRLRLRLLGNSFRRSPWQLLGMILGLVYGLGTALFVIAGLFALRLVDVETARDTEVVFGALVVIAFTIIPLLTGGEDTLDPRRFALFGIPNAKLASALAIASIVSIPSIVLTGIALSLIVTWSRDGISIVLAMLSAVLIVATCLLTARVATSASAFFLGSRRARDITALVGIVILLLFAPVIVSLASRDWQQDGLMVLGEIQRVISWTPLAAAWASPADAANGDLTGAFLKLLIAIAWIGVLWLAWRALVAVMLVAPERQPEARRYAGLGWFDRLPGTPAWAIAARILTYWARDSRYGTSLVVIPLIPVIMVVALTIGGVPLQVLALLPVPVICLFLAWAVHNDVSFDNTAIWLHLSASTSGLADRWGRVIPVLFIGIPVVAIGSPLSVWLFGDSTLLAPFIGVCSSILLCGLGLSSVVSAAAPYPAVRPGDSPFAQPQPGATPAGLIQAISFFAILLLSAPAAYFAYLGFVGSPVWYTRSLLAGIGIGLFVLVVGTVIGGRVYERRATDLLSLSMRN